MGFDSPAPSHYPWAMAEPSVVTIGSFDGVHRGHQALLRLARQLAQPGGLPVRALAFDPHPTSILRPEKSPPRLMSRDRKIQALRAAGADQVVLLAPTRELLDLTPEVFIQELALHHQPMAVVEGPDFRFGKGRAGDMQTLRNLGARFGYQVHIAAPVEVVLRDQLLVPVRSTTIRWLISLGRVEDAARALGWLYALEGTVIHGEHRGRTLGMPTLNFDSRELAPYVMPAHGVYAAMAELSDGSRLPAAVSIGVKPTFEPQDCLVESHLIGFSGDLYGQRVRIALARWVRDQLRFPNVQALREQMQRDIAQVRNWHEAGLLTFTPTTTAMEPVVSSQPIAREGL